MAFRWRSHLQEEQETSRDLQNLSVRKKGLLQKRSQKLVRSSLEANATVYFKEEDYKKIAESEDLSEILISSDVKISDTFDDNFLFNSEDKTIGIKISNEGGEKCPRCWKIFKKNEMNRDLCTRCFKVINESKL